MILNCEICSELITTSNEVKVTTCGHLFHSECVLQWFNRGNDTCPHCRQSATANNLLQVYLTSAEENDVHLDRNCPIENIKEDLKLKESSLDTLRIDFEYMCHENQEYQLKLLSLEDYNTKLINKLKDENNELKLKLNLALDENDKNICVIKEFEEKNKLMEQSLFSRNLKLEEVEDKLLSANNNIERLKFIQDALILQNISNNKVQNLNKCTICKELIREHIENIENSFPCLNSQNNIENGNDERNSDTETDTNNDDNIIAGEIDRIIVVNVPADSTTVQNSTVA